MGDSLSHGVCGWYCGSQVWRCSLPVPACGAGTLGAEVRRVEWGWLDLTSWQEVIEILRAHACSIQYLQHWVQDRWAWGWIG